VARRRRLSGSQNPNGRCGGSGPERPNTADYDCNRRAAPECVWLRRAISENPSERFYRGKNVASVYRFDAGLLPRREPWVLGPGLLYGLARMDRGWPLPIAPIKWRCIRPWRQLGRQAWADCVAVETYITDAGAASADQNSCFDSVRAARRHVNNVWEFSLGARWRNVAGQGLAKHLYLKSGSAVLYHVAVPRCRTCGRPDGAAIINLGAVGGGACVRPWRKISAYAAAKAAVVSFSVRWRSKREAKIGIHRERREPLQHR